MNYAVAKIRAKEAGLLDKNGYLRLSQSRNTKEFVKLLAEYGYDSESDFDGVLSSETLKTYAYVKEAAKSENLLFPFLLKYDLFNIGVYMKAELSGQTDSKKLPYKNCGNFDIPTLVSALRDGRTVGFPDELIKIYNTAKEIYLNTNDISSAQIYLDKNGYEYILNRIKETKSDFVKKYFMTEADIKNLTFALRLKRLDSDELIKELLIDGGYVETGRIIKAFHSSVSDLADVFSKSLSRTSLDTAFDAFSKDRPLKEITAALNENLKSIVEKTRLTAFGTDPIIAYVLNKEAEMSALRDMYYTILAKKQ